MTATKGLRHSAPPERQGRLRPVETGGSLTVASVGASASADADDPLQSAAKVIGLHADPGTNNNNVCMVAPDGATTRGEGVAPNLAATLMGTRHDLTQACAMHDGRAKPAPTMYAHA